MLLVYAQTSSGELPTVQNASRVQAVLASNYVLGFGLGLAMFLEVYPNRVCTSTTRLQHVDSACLYAGYCEFNGIAVCRRSRPNNDELYTTQTIRYAELE
jgi:hypothetical protein